MLPERLSFLRHWRDIQEAVRRHAATVARIERMAANVEAENRR